MFNILHLHLVFIFTFIQINTVLSIDYLSKMSKWVSNQKAYNFSLVELEVFFI